MAATIATVPTPALVKRHIGQSQEDIRLQTNRRRESDVKAAATAEGLLACERQRLVGYPPPPPPNNSLLLFVVTTLSFEKAAARTRVAGSSTWRLLSGSQETQDKQQSSLSS